MGAPSGETMSSMEVEKEINEEYTRSTYTLRLTEEEIVRLRNGETLDRVVWRERTAVGTVEICISVLQSPAGHEEPKKL